MTFLCFLSIFLWVFFVTQIQIFFIDPREGRYFWKHFFVTRRSSNFRMAAYACVTCFWPKRRRFDLGNIVTKNLQVSNQTCLGKPRVSGFFLDFQYFLDLFHQECHWQIAVGPGIRLEGPPSPGTTRLRRSSKYHSSCHSWRAGRVHGGKPIFADFQ